MVHFTADMTIDLALKAHPDAGRILHRLGLMCLGCGGAQSETIAHAAQNHGIPLNQVLDELNAIGEHTRK